MLQSIPCRTAAVLSDIHSNYHAFRACFDDAVSQGADCFLFLGDYISDFADPVKTLELVYEIRANYPTVCLRGNRERYILEHAAGGFPFFPGSKTGSLLYTFRQLRQKDLAFFESIPIADTAVINGIPMEIAHAASQDDRYYFESGDAQIGTVFAQMQCPWLLTGHSHKQYVAGHAGKTILNPGSVGVPRDHGPLSQYALLHFRDDTVLPQFRQIPYDIAATIHSQFESGLASLAPHWAISVLYDAITGEECTMHLLSLVDDVLSEESWHSAAAALGMTFTEHEIMHFLMHQKEYGESL